MAIVKAVSSKASIGTAINYITKNEKTEEKLISGINCTPCIAIDEMKATKEIWNKADGRQYKHYVQSFPKEENITAEQAHQIATELMQNFYKDYEIVIATHNDKDHIHSHIIVNSVSFVDGQKIHEHKSFLQKVKDKSDEICLEQGLSLCEKGEEITTYKIGKYKALERAIKDKNYVSYFDNCYQAVNKAKETAVSREDFINQLQKAGYKTNWNDTRKYITFTDEDGHKIRNSNLEKTYKESFNKEELENGFKRNEETTRTVDSEGTVTRVEQTEQNRAGEQLAQGKFDGIYDTIRDIEAGTKQFSATGRAELSATEEANRKRIEADERDSKQVAERKRDIEPKHKRRDRGFSR